TIKKQDWFSIVQNQAGLLSDQQKKRRLVNSSPLLILVLVLVERRRSESGNLGALIYNTPTFRRLFLELFIVFTQGFQGFFYGVHVVAELFFKVFPFFFRFVTEVFPPHFEVFIFLFQLFNLFVQSLFGILFC